MTICALILMILLISSAIYTKILAVLNRPRVIAHWPVTRLRHNVCTMTNRIFWTICAWQIELIQGILAFRARVALIGTFDQLSYFAAASFDLQVKHQFVYLNKVVLLLWGFVVGGLVLGEGVFLVKYADWLESVLLLEVRHQALKRIISILYFFRIYGFWEILLHLVCFRDKLNRILLNLTEWVHLMVVIH